MVEQADTRDLNPRAEKRAGSIPARGTKFGKQRATVLSTLLKCDTEKSVTGFDSPAFLHFVLDKEVEMW